MIILAINTIGKSCEVAVLNGDVEHEVSEPMARGHDAWIAPIANQVMDDARLEWGQLDRIAVVTGPGSFTGIRVGVSFARGLALALGKPVLGFTTLEVLAGRAGGSMEQLLAIWPAQRRPPDLTWWAQQVVDGIGQNQPVEADVDGVRKLAKGVSRTIGGAPPFDLPIPSVESITTAIAAARLAIGRHPETAPARPVYVRAPDAAPMKPQSFVEDER